MMKSEWSFGDSRKITGDVQYTSIFKIYAKNLTQIVEKWFWKLLDLLVWLKSLLLKL